MSPRLWIQTASIATGWCLRAHLDSRRCHRPRPPASTSILSVPPHQAGRHASLTLTSSGRAVPRPQSPVAASSISSHIVHRRRHQILLRPQPPVASSIISSHIVRRRCHQIQRPHVRCDCRPRWLPHIHALPTAYRYNQPFPIRNMPRLEMEAFPHARITQDMAMVMVDTLDLICEFHNIHIFSTCPRYSK